MTKKISESEKLANMQDDLSANKTNVTCTSATVTSSKKTSESANDKFASSKAMENQVKNSGENQDEKNNVVSVFEKRLNDTLNLPSTKKVNYSSLNRNEKIDYLLTLVDKPSFCECKGVEKLASELTKSEKEIVFNMQFSGAISDKIKILGNGKFLLSGKKEFDNATITEKLDALSKVALSVGVLPTDETQIDVPTFCYVDYYNYIRSLSQEDWEKLTK